MADADAAGLHQIAEGTWAWLAPTGGWGWSNAGLVAGDGGALLVANVAAAYRSFSDGVDGRLDTLALFGAMAALAGDR